MKKSIIYVFTACFFIILSSCKKDLSNYEYKEINSLEISNIEESYKVTNGSSPEIYPELSFSKDPSYNEEDYEYKWISFRDGALPGDQRKDVYTGKNFDIPFPLGVGNYTMFYVVKEKSTNVTWQRKFNITVEGTFRGGWAILSEVANNARVDYFEYDHLNETNHYPKEYRNFTSLFADGVTGKGLEISGKPTFIQGWNNRIPAAPVSKYFIYVGTSTQTQLINVSDGFLWKENYDFKFSTQGLSNIEKIMPATAGAGFGFADGNVYLTYNVYQRTFSTPINRLSNGSVFTVSKYTAVNRIAGPNAIILMYDTMNKRFVRSTGGNLTATTPLPYNEGSAAFDPNNVGMDLVWMAPTDAFGGYAYALLTQNGKYYLARMQNGSAFVASYIDEVTQLPEISQATHFAVDQQYGAFQYAVGGKLYQYDVDTKESKLMKDFGARIITLLKYDNGVAIPLSITTMPNFAATFGKRFYPAYSSLICATYDPAQPDNSGKVEFFNVPQFNQDYTTNYSFDKFGKVVDVSNIETPYGW